MDVEIVQVLRRLVRESTISVHRAQEAIDDLLDLKITRYPHYIFLPRLWHYRHNLSAYGAAYVTLAEELGATLVTRDSKLASAVGRVARVELF
jgi:predicted nucleic acid-binding protein